MLLLAVCASACTACSSLPGSFGANLTDQGQLLSEGPPAHMTAVSIQVARADAVPLLYEFAIEAGQITGPTSPGAVFPADTVDAKQAALLTPSINWIAVTLVGEGYVDTQCDQFLSALAALERAKRVTLANLNALQSATVGIMGLAVAAQKAIGIVGVAFGLSASLVNNTTSSVLYELPAASVRTIVIAQRDLLRAQERQPAGPLAQIVNQGLASARLSEYVQYCVPVTISGNVAKVLNNSRAVPDGKIETADTSPVVSSALAVPRSGIPPGVPQVWLQRTPIPVPNPTGTLLDRKVRVLDELRASNDRAALTRIADALQVPVSQDMTTEILRAQIILFINKSVSAQNIDTFERVVTAQLGAAMTRGEP
jgi:hypothetical protein